jgi:hypothetical protein
MVRVAVCAERVAIVGRTTDRRASLGGRGSGCSRRRRRRARGCRSSGTISNELHTWRSSQVFSEDRGVGLSRVRGVRPGLRLAGLETPARLGRGEAKSETAVGCLPAATIGVEPWAWCRGKAIPDMKIIENSPGHLIMMCCDVNIYPCLSNTRKVLQCSQARS